MSSSDRICTQSAYLILSAKVSTATIKLLNLIRQMSWINETLNNECEDLCDKIFCFKNGESLENKDLVYIFMSSNDR